MSTEEKQTSTETPATAAPSAPASSATTATTATVMDPPKQEPEKDKEEEEVPEERQSISGKHRSSVQFPWTLHQLLSEAEMNGNSSIISWVPGTNAFKVHNKVRFTNDILPQYFNANKYKSFQRNLNLWGFETIQDGPNKGAVFHRLFIRGQREQCHYMSRQKVKGVNGKSGPPIKGSIKVGAGATDALADLAPAMAGAVKSSMLSPEDLKALPFPKKLHHILAQPSYTDCLCWTPDGRCIRVVDPFKFQEKVAITYFSHTSFSSFLVELESYGFKKVSHFGFQECYYHDLMIRGCPHLCKYMFDSRESRKFSSEDPSKDLLIDQAFGVPSILPQAPGLVTAPQMGALGGMMGHDPAAAGAFVQEFQQRQQLATLQFLAASGGNPNAQMGLGFNPALLGSGVASTGRRASVPKNYGAAPTSSKHQENSLSSTPISSYLANSSQNTGGGGSASRTEAAV